MSENGNPAPEHHKKQAVTEAETLLRTLAGLSSPTGLSGKPLAPGMSRPDNDARYRTFIEQIPAVIFLAFLHEGVSEAYVSPHIETILGFTQQEWLRDPILWYHRIHPKDRERWSIEAAQLVLMHKPLRSMYRVIARDGHVVWFHCQVKIVLSADGRPWFIHGTAIDITDLKRAESKLQQAHDELELRVRQRTAALEQSNAELKLEIAERKRAESQLAQKAAELARSNTDLEQFAYSASHDLQEPLRNIAVYSQLLADRYRDKLDAQANEFLDVIGEGAQRMIMMVRDLLAYTRTANASADSYDLVDSNAVLARCIEDLGVAIRESQAVITSDPLPCIQIPEIHLHQLFQNLISNGIRYRGAEPPHIHISAAVLDGQCVFSVVDNGIGIASKYREQIFGIFKRLHGRDEYPGTGIGLAICKKIVERYGGRIWVESQPNQGAAFFFAVPAVSASHPFAGSSKTYT